ncbi:response regulator transcription factor [Chloroflexota bacterium]
MKEIRVLLVDNNEIVRRGLRGMLEEEEDVEIVGDCSSAEEALHLTEILSPNIILLDTEMPGMGGIEATRRYCQKQPPAKIIMLTLCEDCLAEALEAGAVGYLLKDIKRRELAQAIRRVYSGELVIDERFTLQGVEDGSEYLPQGCDSSGTLVKEAELVILPPIDAARLLRFAYQVEDALGATILQQVGSWDKGTVITIRLRKVTPLLDLLDRSGKMPDVEDVIDQSIEKRSSFGLPQKNIAKLRIHPRKKFLVALKQTSPAEQLESTEPRAN